MRCKLAKALYSLVKHHFFATFAIWVYVIQINLQIIFIDNCIRFQGTVSDYLSVCKELGIEVVLIDKKILEHLTERVKRYSEEGKNAADEHKSCHYFCTQNTFTFGVFKPLFEDKNHWVSCQPFSLTKFIDIYGLQYGISSDHLFLLCGN